MGMMAINMAGSIAGHNAENAAVKDRNNAVAKANYRNQKEKAQEVVVPVILTRIASMAAFVFRRSL